MSNLQYLQSLLCEYISAHPYNLTIVQFYAPTSAASKDDLDANYEAL